MTSRRRARAQGQGLAETALIIPVFFMLLMGLVDVGRAVFTYSTIGEAARQAVRVAAVNQLANSIGCEDNRPVETADTSTAHWSPLQCAIAAGKTVGLTAADVSVSYAAPSGTALVCQTTPTVNLTVGCYATVTVQTTWLPITPLASTILGPIHLSTTSTMPIERVFP
jgi:Flp pilus assembly protein TadG